MIDVSVIVAASRDDVAATIESLAAQTGDNEFEVIIVADDDMSKPGGDVIWIVSPTNNPATKRNMGARAAKGRILAFTDDDAVVSPDWISAIVNIMDGRPNIAGVGGPNLAPDDQSDAERLTDALLGSKLGSGTATYSGGDEEKSAAVGDIHLVNFAVRRDFFLALGGFNETLGYGAEDSEFIYVAQRVQSSRFVYLPELKVYHRRRSFGWPLLKQRFTLRSQNGRLLWTRPSMYIRNRFFTTALLGAIFGPPVAAMCPLLAALAIVIYATMLFMISKSKHVGRIKWIAATAAVHLVSMLGIVYGFIRAPSSADYAGLSRRPR